MASGETSHSDGVEPETYESSRLARREDLYNTFGIMLTVPKHVRDHQGNVRFGQYPEGGLFDNAVVDQFTVEMETYIASQVSNLVEQGLLTADQAKAIRSHPYSVGPLAQEWPKIFFDFYQDARSFLNDGASLLAWGYFLSDIVRGLWSWASNKEREPASDSDESGTVYSGRDAMPGIALTRPALIALCYKDLVERHGLKGTLTLDSFARSPWPDYMNANHPGGAESYVIRAKRRRQSYFYHIDGTGMVLEHYLTDGNELIPLELPNFVGEQERNHTRSPKPAERVEIKSK